MKLVVMIPAYNEEALIASVINEIPRDACETVKVLVVDDGSTDRTVQEARKIGADEIVSHKQNKGLASAFRLGLETSLDMGADIIVNTDADGQYVGNEISKLIKPIVDGEADIVLGSRFEGTIEEMPLSKRFGNRIATKVTRFVSGTSVTDAQTGFRAFSREAALRLNVMAEYTYVQETIIQAAHKKLKIVEVPIHFRKREGKSKLISNIFDYAGKAGVTIIRSFVAYNPLKVFIWIGSVILLMGFASGLRVLLLFLETGDASPYTPTVVLAAILMIIGFQIIVLGLIADMIGNNRLIQEEILYRLKKEKKRFRDPLPKK